MADDYDMLRCRIEVVTCWWSWGGAIGGRSHVSLPGPKASRASALLYLLRGPLGLVQLRAWA